MYNDISLKSNLTFPLQTVGTYSIPTVQQNGTHLPFFFFFNITSIFYYYVKYVYWVLASIV